MTTIVLEHPDYNDITIDAAKVEESLSKEISTWPKNFYAPADLPVTPTDQIPIRQSMDFLNVTREFTINGTIDGNSISNGNALKAREVLVNMLRSGGTLIFRYGLPSDVTGSNYSPSSNNMYFNQGFSVHMRRLMVVEKPKGGSGSEFSTPEYTGNAIKNAPEEYEVTITLTWAEDLTA